MMGEREHIEQIDKNAYSVTEFDQISRDTNRWGRKKRGGPDNSDALNPADISNSLPPPGKRKKHTIKDI